MLAVLNSNAKYATPILCVSNSRSIPIERFPSLYFPGCHWLPQVHCSRSESYRRRNEKAADECLLCHSCCSWWPYNCSTPLSPVPHFMMMYIIQGPWNRLATSQGTFCLALPSALARVDNMLSLNQWYANPSITNSRCEQYVLLVNQLKEQSLCLVLLCRTSHCYEATKMATNRQ